jgi:PleD family two-component response regulator
VEKFDGYIDFISKFKKGTTFFYTFEFDLVEEVEWLNVTRKKTCQIGDLKIMKAETRAIESSCLNGINSALQKHDLFMRHQHNRILIVDDEEFCISSMKAILYNFGVDIDYQVDFCITGQEAIQQV